MNQASIPISDLAAASKRIARGAVEMGQNRLELLIVEVQETREHLLRSFFLALGMAVFGLLAGVAFTIGVVILFWDRSPLAAVGVLTIVYGAAAFFLRTQLVKLQREWQTFPSTLDEFRKDSECLASILH